MHLDTDAGEHIPRVTTEINNEYYRLKEHIFVNEIKCKILAQDLLPKVCMHYTREKGFLSLSNDLLDKFLSETSTDLTGNHQGKNYLFLFVVFIHWNGSWRKYTFRAFLGIISRELHRNPSKYKRKKHAEPPPEDKHPAWRDINDLKKWGMPDTYIRQYIHIYDTNIKNCPSPEAFLQAWQHEMELTRGLADS